MAKAGVESAILNVKINLESIKDTKYVEKTIKELEQLKNNVDRKTNEIIKIVEKSL